MKQHPILFSTPMVQAILEGRKTQTRRDVKIQVESQYCKEFTGFESLGHYIFLEPEELEKPEAERMASLIHCRYGEPGDLLWVRETWTPAITPHYLYKADDTYLLRGRWRPSIHMPKTAARIWLEIEEVKVERLLSITFADASAEGVAFNGSFWFDYLNNEFTKLNSCASFASLWCKINGTENWNLNPWVWVVKFKVLSTTGMKSTTSHALLSPPSFSKEGSALASAMERGGSSAKQTNPPLIPPFTKGDEERSDPAARSQKQAARGQHPASNNK